MRWDELRRPDMRRAVKSREELSWDMLRRMEKLRRAEKRRVQMSWEEMRKGKKTWDEMRWDEVKNIENTHDMRWDEAGWHRLRWQCDARAMSKRSCDALKLDKMRFGSIGYRRFNFETSAPACPGTTCTNDLPNLALKQWRVHSQAGKFAVVFGLVSGQEASWVAEERLGQHFCNHTGWSAAWSFWFLPKRRTHGNVHEENDGKPLDVWCALHYCLDRPTCVAHLAEAWLGLRKKKQTENGAILGQQSLAIFGGQYQLYTQLHI